MKYLLALWLTVLSIAPASAQYWQHCTLPAPYNSNYFLDVYFLPSNPQYGWVCGFNGMTLRTTDGGTTWQGSVVPYQGRNGGHLESIHFPSQQIGYCSGPCGCFKSTDGGASWVDITPPIPSGQNPWGLYFLNVNWGVLLAGGCGSPQYFLQTSNGGTNWSTFTGNLGSSGLSDLILYPNGSGIAISSGNLWSSNDSGRTWSPFQPSFTGVWDEEITVSGSSIIVPYSGTSCAGAGSGGGVRFSTDNGATWNSFNTNNNMFGAYLLSPSTGWLCGNARNMWRTTDAGANWELKNCGIDGDLDDCWFVNDSTGFVVGNGVYRYMPAERSLSKTGVDFGSFCFPGERFDTVWVRNRSNNGASATWSLSGSDVQHFSVLQPLSTNFGIPTCDSALIVLRFQPRSVGAKSVTLTVTVSGSPPMTITLTGTSRNNGTVPADTLAILNPAPCGTPVRVVTLWNNATQLSDQIIQIQRVSGAVLTPEVSVPVIIPPGGGSVGFTITLADTGWQIGRYLMRVGPCLRDTIFTIKAYGVSPIINTPAQRTYISKCMSTVIDSIPVTNTGNADLIISNNYIASGSPDFAILGWSTGESLPVTIKRNATKYLLIRFTPLGAGPKSAVLKLTNNDQTTIRGIRSLVDILLQGQSSGVSDSLSRRFIDFGKICAPANLTKIVTIYNTGSSDFTLNASLPRSTEFRALGDRAIPATVHSGDSVTFAVTFTSSTPGLYLDSLVLAVTPCDSAPIVIPLRAEVINTVLNVNPTSIDTTMRAGTTAILTVEVSSSGTANAVIDAIVLSPSRPDWKILSQPNLPLTLTPGSKALVTIELNPQTSTTYSGQLIFNASAQCSTSVSTSIRVNVSETQISISRSKIDFGVDNCTIQDRSDSLVIRNDGATPDSLLSAQIVGSVSGTFTLISPTTLPLAIALGQPVSVVVRSSQALEGVDSATLVLRFAHSYSAADVLIPLRREFHKTITATLDTLLDFGQAEPCDLPRTLVIHFRNNGTLDDDLRATLVNPDPTLTLSRTAVHLKAGSSDSIEVRFDPRSQPARVLQSVLNWQSSVCPLTIATTIRARIVDPHLSISPSKLDFGLVWKGGSRDLFIGVANHSAAARTLTTIDVSGPQSADYKVDYTPNQLMQPGDSLTATVHFNAGAVGDANANILVRESSSCQDSTLIPCTAVVPKELYLAQLLVEKGVVVEVNDTADVAVRLLTNDTSDMSLAKAKPRSIVSTLHYNNGVMNVLRVFRRFNATEVDLPNTCNAGELVVTVPDSMASNLGSTDTLFFVRAQGMQNIPNYTLVQPATVVADVPPGKDYVITTDPGDFSVQACVKWARIVVSEPFTVTLRSQPSDQYVELDVHGVEGQTVDIAMSAVSGQLVFKDFFTLLSQNSLFRVSTHELAAGTYFLELRDAFQRRSIVKVIIAH